MGTCWCWWTNHEWEAYGDEHSGMIEEAFLEGASSMTLDLFGVEYKVDFVRMVQQNRMTGFPRPVWRCSEEVSGKQTMGAPNFVYWNGVHNEDSLHTSGLR